MGSQLITHPQDAQLTINDKYLVTALGFFQCLRLITESESGVAAGTAGEMGLFFSSQLRGVLLTVPKESQRDVVMRTDDES